ncbi:MAG: glycosyltransferase family 87 protein, partial [Chloroflexota bacterium]
MKLKKINFAKPLLAAGIAFQVVWYVLLWARFVSSPELKGADFISFYTAGLIAKSGHISQIYDLQLQHDIQQNVVGKQIGPEEFLPFLHPPFLVPLQSLITSSNYAASYQRWSLVLLAFVGIGAYILWRLLRAKGWDHKARTSAVLTTILFYPIFISILKGQDTAFLLIGALLWLYGLAYQDDRLAGLSLSLALIRPQVAIVLAIPFLFKRQRILVWFFFGAIVLLIYSVLLVGIEGVQSFITTLFVSAGGEGYGLNQSVMFNFTGLALRLFPQIDPIVIRWLAWGLFAAAVVGLSVLWKVSASIRLRHLGLAVVTSLFVAPHLHYHELALLVIPLLGLGLAGVTAGRLTVPRAA